MKTKVIAPNQHYTGMSATVPFVNGVGETDNEHLLSWFEGKGYTLERPEPEPEPAKEPDDDKVKEPQTDPAKEPEPEPAKEADADQAKPAKRGK